MPETAGRGERTAVNPIVVTGSDVNSTQRPGADPVRELGPLMFAPILKPARWGGTRLGARLGKDVPAGQRTAESWEISDLIGDSSIVTDGPLDGKSLHQLVVEFNLALLGRHSGCTRFPLLCKFLDASDRLSVQVHPDDAYARRHGCRYSGKSEAWVIVDAAPHSRIYAGLRPGIDRAALVQSIQAGTVAECLESQTVRPGDCFSIPAGTVHAIGEGIVLAEIQQPSDLTFRLFDWNRTDSSGQPRQLHIAESLECIDFEAAAVRRAEPQRLLDSPHCVEVLLQTPQFEIRRHRGPSGGVFADDNRFRILMVVDGAPTVVCGGVSWRLAPGRTVLLPARRAPTELECPDDAVVLETFLPVGCA